MEQYYILGEPDLNNVSILMLNMKIKAFERAELSGHDQVSSLKRESKRQKKLLYCFFKDSDFHCEN